jgi:hypothetical protein
VPDEAPEVGRTSPTILPSSDLDYLQPLPTQSIGEVEIVAAAIAAHQPVNLG